MGAVFLVTAFDLFPVLVAGTIVTLVVASGFVEFEAFLVTTAFVITAELLAAPGADVIVMLTVGTFAFGFDGGFCSEDEILERLTTSREGLGSVATRGKWEGSPRTGRGGAEVSLRLPPLALADGMGLCVAL